MSLAALLASVRNTVRLVVQVTDAECDCRDNGAPVNAQFNQQFFAVHPTQWFPGDLDDINGPGGVNHEYAVSVTITKKVGIVPPDRRFDTVFLNGLDSFESQATQIINAVHQSQDVMAFANSLITRSKYFIIEPLRWLGCDPTPVDRGGEWIGSKPTPNPVAQSLEIRFGRARRTVGINPALGQQAYGHFED